MGDTLRELTNGGIGAPYRSPAMQGVGALADLINTFAAQAGRVGVTIPQSSPILAGKSLTLRDMTVGDLGRVLEDISYGMPPMRGGNYATGGIGTYGAKPDVMELANAIPAGAAAGKVAISGARRLAPTAAEMVRKRADTLMDISGGRMHAVPTGGRTMPTFVPDDALPARNLIEVHGVKDKSKLDHLVDDMKKNGWRGDPLLVFDDGNGTYALNGSHRIAAARQTGIDIPVIYVDDSKLMSALDETGETFDEIIGSGDDRVADFLRKAGDMRGADLMNKEFETAIKEQRKQKK